MTYTKRTENLLALVLFEILQIVLLWRMIQDMKDFALDGISIYPSCQCELPRQGSKQLYTSLNLACPHLAKDSPSVKTKAECDYAPLQLQDGFFLQGTFWVTAEKSLY